MNRQHVQPAESVEPDPSVEPAASYSRVRLVAGLLGRSWLWFLAGCLVITLVPLLFGWRPFLIESGSMEPRIAVGDVVIAAPEQDPQVLLGRVTVFTDPAAPANTKTHRVVQLAADGTLVTKGDANPTPDSVHVPISNVRGMGRLLVRFVGLPAIWVQTGQWVWLALLLLSVGLSVRSVGRDHEDDESGADEPTDPPDHPSADVVPFPSSTTSPTSLDVAASRPMPLESRAAGRRWVRRLGYGAVLAAALVVPTSTAAFSATTRSTSNSWSVPNYSYTTEVKALSPWLYWKLDDTGSKQADTTVADSSGKNRPGTYFGEDGDPDGRKQYFTKGVTGALMTDTPNRAVSLNDPKSCIALAGGSVAAPAQLTEIVWFKAPNGYKAGGKLLGFERPQVEVDSPSAGQYDRMLYLDGNGRLWFGVYNGGYHLLSTPGSVADGDWHMAAATMGTGGMRLYLDGVQVAANANSAGESNADGWWRAGCGNLAGWATGWSGPNTPPPDSDPTNYPFMGSLDEISVWNSALTASQIGFLYFTR